MNALFKGIDYATTAAGPLTATEIKAAKYNVVFRYISKVGWPKNITKKELDDLHSSGIVVGLFYEIGGSWAAGGTGAGIQAVADVKKALSDLGLPEHTFVYYSIDFDIPDYAPTATDHPANALAKLGPVGLCFREINKTFPTTSIGVYGGYYAVKRVLDTGIASKGFQTPAWSGGQVDSRIVAFQTTTKAKIGAYDVDVDEFYNADYGFVVIPDPVKVDPPKVDPPNVPHATWWKGFHPQMIDTAFGTVSVKVPTPRGEGVYNIVGNVCIAQGTMVVPKSSVDGIAVTLPVKAAQRYSQVIGTLVVFGRSAPNQSGAAYLTDDMSAVFPISYEGQYLNANEGEVIRYAVTYNV